MPVNRPKKLRGQAMAEFIRRAAWENTRAAPLQGDASTRRYIRLHRGDRTAMLMDQPQNVEAPAAGPNATPTERRALGYNAMARLAGADCERFVAIANYLRRRGLSAPEIYASDAKEGFVLLEDLGDALYVDVLTRGGNEASTYGAAIDALVTLHAEPPPKSFSSSIALYPYDEVALIAETDLITDWYMPVALGRRATPLEVEEHRCLWREVLAPCQQASVFVHRDYHVFNLFWLPERGGAASVGMIDFQDALAGGAAYDLISLLQDARREVSPELAEAMTNRYLAKRKAEGIALDETQFRTEAAVLAAQRNAKIIGIFSRLWKRDRKPRYLGYVPRVWRYIERDLSHPALAKLKTWYEHIIPREKRMRTIEGT
ncbi:MAG: aminoglycoside phosphotransferase family protein [Alphaproteobacteria bacterium]